MWIKRIKIGIAIKHQRYWTLGKLPIIRMKLLLSTYVVRLTFTIYGRVLSNYSLRQINKHNIDSNPDTLLSIDWLSSSWAISSTVDDIQRDRVEISNECLIDDDNYSNK